MKAVILAGGLGVRLRPFTQAIPKPLLPIGEQSLLEIQIANLANNGFSEIFIATNYKSEYIESFIGDGSKHGVAIAYSREREPLGTCGPLSLLRDRLDEPFVMVNGDILSTIDFRRFVAHGNSMEGNLTVATKQVRTPFNFGSVQADGDRITGVDEKPDLLIEVVAGMYYMRPALLEQVPDGEYFGVDQLIRGMLAEGLPVHRYCMTEYWLDIGAIDDYKQAEDAHREHFDSD
ncbi:MAG: mannose-1-phosphate guanyltransferase [Deltaproteobacteria bacterium]|nr:mannose-1-phosphate guanyltransferase [Deltaproteobacteria bacterium]